MATTNNVPEAALVSLDDVRIGIVGLGYVGLPLAVYLARRFSVVGFDVDTRRIEELRKGVDRTREVIPEEIELARSLNYTAREADLKDCNFYIITVPTPIDAARRPDLTALRKASETVGRVIKQGDIVVFESTVYPGATEEVCVPILEERSSLVYNRDFFVGYSPERINPGDPTRRLPDVRKITSGSTSDAADLIDRVYSCIIKAGTFRASSIRVAEAAKVIENIQRDLNIALVNELAQLFKRLDLETTEVLEAAATKWNFHSYYPGLVGGHCIGVDPYYLTHKAQSIGFHPEIILAGRRVNDGMAAFLAHDIIKEMATRKVAIGQARLLIMGFTFKENCPDIRNTKVADLVRELRPFASEIVTYDPLADPAEALHEHGIKVERELPEGKFDGIIIAVRHGQIIDLGAEWMTSRLKLRGGLIYDVREVKALR